MSHPSETIKALSRGDTPLKINNWPTAIVAGIGILTAGAVLVFLVEAGWSAEGIAAFVTLAAGIFGGQALQARKTASVEAKTDQQSETLETIVRQTNGELKRAVREAVRDEMRGAP